MKVLKRYRWFVLVICWFTLSGWGPVEEGTDASLELSGGEYEFGACNTVDRYRHAGTRGSVRYRFEDTPMYLGAEAGGYTERRIAERTRKTEKTPGGTEYTATTFDMRETVGTEYLSGGMRLGVQASLLGAETGLMAIGDRYRTNYVPFGTLRLRPRPRHSFEISVWEQSPVRTPFQVGSMAYVYAGENWRFTTGIAFSLATAWRADIEKHLGRGNWLGLGLDYAGDGVFGPQAAALLRYRWSDSKPMPENWSDVKNPDILIRPFLKKEAPKQDRDPSAD